MPPSDQGFIQNAETEIENIGGEILPEAEKVGEAIVQEAETIIGDVAAAIAPIIEGLVTAELANLSVNSTATLADTAAEIAKKSLPAIEAAGIKASVSDVLNAVGSIAKSFEANNGPIVATNPTPAA